MNLLETTNTTLQNASSHNQVPDSGGLVSEGVLKTFLNYSTILSPFLATVCLVACFLNIAVNCKQRRDACTYYLLAMSVGDGVYLCCSMLGYLGAHIWGDTKREITMMNLYLNVLPTTISRNFAIVLNSLASLERFLVLVFPFKVSANLLNRFPRAVIVFVFGFTVLGHVSLGLEFQVAEVQPHTWGLEETDVHVCVKKQENAYVVSDL
ncbi:hypothetical protein C0Q70_18314 [Pomacea canaliculata]|uniref:G-protein coupled receptors family 1 profile domain-containing protein n=1 Tax=Pomacea canaliculata TaxID=400727 RepID=A0A2T7NMV5_POMCA|nr:hypothetical protein C0Q70_18314 [Pomacea canaliculata]